VVGAMWQDYYDELTATGKSGDPTPNARELLTGPYTRKIPTPNRMTLSELDALATHSPHDTRLAVAVAASGENGEVIQHLTGGPELVEGYLDGGLFNPVERALITGALEARRLGHLRPIPGELLAEAADGYLLAQQRPGRPDWSSTALTAITSGIRADNTRTDIRRTLTALTEYRARAGQSEVAYEPNEFLDQNTRTQRLTDLGAPELWSALSSHSATAGDLHSVGNAAQLRGFYRYAAQMWLRAVHLGDSTAAAPLLRALIRIEDQQQLDEACEWILRNNPLDSPRVADALIRALNQAGRGNVVVTLATKAAEQVTLDSLRAVASLITTMLRNDARTAAVNLAVRASDQGSIDSPRGVVDILDVLLGLELGEAVTTLAERACVGVPLDSSRGVSTLIRRLRMANANEAAGKLELRAAKEMPLNNPRAVAILIRRLREAESNDALANLISRNPVTEASLHSFNGVCSLIRELGKSGFGDMATALTWRALNYSYTWDLKSTAFLARTLDESEVDLPVKLSTQLAFYKDSTGVNELAGLLHDAGADPSLAESAALAAHLANARTTGASLRALQAAGASLAFSVFADWISEHIPLEDPRTIAAVIVILVKVAAHDAAARLADRAADYACVEDVRSVFHLLTVMRNMGADEATAKLATRAAENGKLDEPRGVAALLRFMISAELQQPINILIARNPATATHLKASGLGRLARALHDAGDEGGASHLLRRAVDSGTIGGEYLFTYLAEATAKSSTVQGLKTYGREPDGNPSRPWDWRDIALIGDISAS